MLFYKTHMATSYHTGQCRVLLDSTGLEYPLNIYPQNHYSKNIIKAKTVYLLCKTASRQDFQLSLLANFIINIDGIKLREMSVRSRKALP
jgi:hypothetical protein